MSTNTVNKAVHTKNTQLISIRIPHDLVAGMRRMAQYTGQTQTQIVEEALRRYLAQISPMDVAAAPVGGAPAIDDDEDEPDEINDDIPDHDFDHHCQPRQRGLWGAVAKGGKGY